MADSQAAMTRLKEGFLRLIKDTNERHQRDKNALLREFDLLRATLAAKEKELTRQLDDLNKQNLSALTKCLEVINGNY